LLISFTFVGALFSSICIGTQIKVSENQTVKKISNIKNSESRGTEYWALLVAVGVYYNHPDMNRQSMLDAVDNLYSTLLDSPNWQADHIHVLKAGQATTFNLIKELIWLILSEDSDDYSFIYITTHGGPLTRNGQPWDVPPKDETDGDDEVLAMYYGFERFDHFTDDMLNFFLRFMKSKGICVMIDSCYSGGFDDSFKSNGKQMVSKNAILRNFESRKYVQGMVGELSAQGRVVLMSCGEEELSYSSYFSDYITSGFGGWADLTGNLDGINSAEEAFNFAYPWVVILTMGDQHPTILDRYTGEIPITYS